MKTGNQIEAVLFYKNEPVSLKELSKLLEKSEEEIKAGLEELKSNLENRGLALLQEGENLSLATSRENSDLIEKMAKEELSKDIGKAGLETLSIIIYKGEATRREVDYIRGVNSTFILRALVVRGLVEKVGNGSGARSFVYKPTLELLALLGVESREALNQLPRFEEVRKEIETIEKSEENENY